MHFRLITWGCRTKCLAGRKEGNVLFNDALNTLFTVIWRQTGVTKAVVCAILSGMVHIKEPLLLIEKSSPCGGSGFPLSLCEWYFTISTAYNRK